MSYVVVNEKTERIAAYIGIGAVVIIAIFMILRITGVV